MVALARLSRISTLFALPMVLAPILLACSVQEGGQANAADTEVVLELSEGTNMSAAASPDGQWIAIDLLEDLWLVPAEGGQARRLTTDPAREVEPRWSPDGRRLVFSSNRNRDYDLWILEVASGQTTPLTSGPADDREPDWSPDGRSIVFSSNRHRIAGETSAIYAIPAEGGEVRALTSGQADDLQPAYSPDGQWIAFASARSGVYRIWRVPAQGGDASVVGSQDDNVENFGPGWSNDGRLVWSQTPYPGARHVSNGQLAIEGSDPGSSRTLTEPADLFPLRSSRFPNGELLFVADGKIGAVHPETGEVRQIPFEARFTFTRNRFEPRLPELPGPGRYPVRGITSPKISPDGTHIAFAALSDVWILTIGDPMPIRITDGPGENTHPVWSPDGRQVVFSSDRGSSSGRVDYELWSVAASGGPPTRLTNRPGPERGQVFSPDGTKIAFSDFVEGGLRYWIESVGGEPREIARVPGGDMSFSPDGQRLYVPRWGAPEPARLDAISITGGATEPFLTGLPPRVLEVTMSADGQTLVYVERSGRRLWLQELSQDGERQGEPRLLTDGSVFYPSLSADGRRLAYLTSQGLVLQDLGSGTITPIPLELYYEVPANRSSLLVRNVRLIDGTGAPLREGVDILVRDGRIAQVAPTGTIPLEGTPIVDAEGRTAIPGLIDSHEHSNAGSRPMGARLYFGVTSARDLASPSYALLNRVEAIRSGREMDARIFYAGEIHDVRQGRRPGNFGFDNDSQLDAELTRLADLGYHVGKSRTLNDQAGFIAKNHELGRPVTGHWSVQAVLLGTDGREHLPRVGRSSIGRPFPPFRFGTNAKGYDDYLQLAARSGVWLTPTLLAGGAGMGHNHPGALEDPVLGQLLPAVNLDRAKVEAADPVRVARRAASHQMRLAQLRRIVDLGGRVLAGTDTQLSGISLHWELENFVEAGMTPMQALQAVTGNAATALGYASELGTIEVGKIADIVLLDADPLEDISNTLRIATVIQEGRVVDREALLRD